MILCPPKYEHVGILDQREQRSFICGVDSCRTSPSSGVYRRDCDCDMICVVSLFFFVIMTVDG